MTTTPDLPASTAFLDEDAPPPAQPPSVETEANAELAPWAVPQPPPAPYDAPERPQKAPYGEEPQYMALIDAEGAQVELLEMSVKTEIHISTATVTLEGKYKYGGAAEDDLILTLPMTRFGTVTAVEIEIGHRIFETIVISHDEAQQYMPEVKEAADGKEVVTDGKNFSKYNPDLFELPIANVKPGDTPSVKVVYIETLQYENSAYYLSVPTVLPNAKTPFDAEIMIEAACAEYRWGCSSHHLSVVKSALGRILVTLDKTQPRKNVDLTIEYMVATDRILASALVQDADADSADKRGALGLFVTPPRHDTFSGVTRKKVMFLLDRSGSMKGRPLKQAKEAMKLTLDMLSPEDYFCVVMFDHEQKTVPEGLAPATERNVTLAKQWIDQHEARGGTDILTPVQTALRYLQDPSMPPGLPSMFLVTDGCVSNEREICKFVQKKCTFMRCFTFGIGPYCNTFFLRMIAQLGRGASDFVYRIEDVEFAAKALVRKASTPAMTDVTLNIPDIEALEMCPFPLPDLLLQAPVIVTARYKGVFPENLTLSGYDPSGVRSSVPVQVRPATNVPLQAIFTKQRLDILSANAWLRDSSKEKKEAIALSVAESVPCAYTTMIAYETTKAEVDARDEKDEKAWSKKKKAALAAGIGVVAVGAAMMTFGDAGSTAAGLLLGGGGDLVGGDGGDCDCAECCTECCENIKC